MKLGVQTCFEGDNIFERNSGGNGIVQGELPDCAMDLRKP